MPLMNVAQSQALAEKYGFEFPESRKVLSEAEVIKACQSLGFPLAMKILSEKISHKTEAGGVKLNLKSEKEALQAFRALKKLKGFQGVLVQEMLSGVELIIGGKVDPQFGPVVLFGLGGVFVEAIKDVSLRICPITGKDAREMIHEIKGFKLLQGFRSLEPVNLKLLEKLLLQACQLMQKENIKELDLNPLIASKSKIKAIDARIIT